MAFSSLVAKARARCVTARFHSPFHPRSPSQRALSQGVSMPPWSRRLRWAALGAILRPSPAGGSSGPPP
eukprot:2042772-Alexandrium_andersonii.AAC.1